MPNPKAIDVSNLGFSEEQMTVLHIMMNNEDKDYSTVDEIARLDELTAYSYGSIHHHTIKSRILLIVNIQTEVSVDIIYQRFIIGDSKHIGIACEIFKGSADEVERIYQLCLCCLLLQADRRHCFSNLNI